MNTKPPGWLYLSVVFATALVTLWLASVYEWYGIQLFLLVLIVWIPLIGVWAVRYGLAASSDRAVASARRWFAPWFIVGSVMIALVLDAPLWIRFAVSAPSMTAFAEAVIEEGPPQETCRWLGLYYMCYEFQYSTLEGEDVPGSAAFGVEDGFYAEGKGFLYLPEGVPEETGDDSYRHLIGPWYAWQGWNHW